METINVVCPNCMKINRIPKKDSYAKAVCGNCKHNLLDTTPIHLNDSNFDYFIANTQLPVIVDFWAEWCAPCKMFAPTFSQIAANYPLKIQFAKVNTEEAPNIAAKNRIRSIPTIVAFKNGVEIDRISGALPAPQFNEWVRRFL